MRPPKGLLVPFLAPVIFWRLSRANLAIPKTPGHKKRSRSDECGLFYVLKVVLIVAVDFEMLVISCGKRSTHGQPNMDSGVQFTSDILCNRLLKMTQQRQNRVNFFVS